MDLAERARDLAQKTLSFVNDFRTMSLMIRRSLTLAEMPGHWAVILVMML